MDNKAGREAGSLAGHLLQGTRISFPSLERWESHVSRHVFLFHIPNIVGCCDDG